MIFTANGKYITVSAFLVIRHVIYYEVNEPVCRSGVPVFFKWWYLALFFYFTLLLYTFKLVLNYM